MGSILLKSDDGKQYKLAYNRSAVVRMEKAGFNVANIDKEPATTITLLIRGAFYMYNPSLSDDEIDAIADQIECGDELIKALVELYGLAVMSLSGGDKKQSKNFKWERC